MQRSEVLSRCLCMILVSLAVAVVLVALLLLLLLLLRCEAGRVVNFRLEYEDLRR